MEVRNETLTEYHGRVVGSAGVGGAGSSPCPHFRRTAERRKASVSGLPIAYRNANTAPLPAAGDADATTYTASNIDQAAGATYQSTNTYVYARSANAHS